MSYPEPTRSPRRNQIMAMLEKKQMTAAQIGEAIGLSRDSAYAFLTKMAASNQVCRVTRSNQAFWTKYVPPKKINREHPIMTGTTKGKLDLSFMQSPYRAGSMDAYSIPSKGIK